MEKRRSFGMDYEGMPVYIRFAYKDRELPPNPITTPIFKETKLRGKAIETSGMHFLPRAAKVKINNEVVDVISYFWIFYSCIKDSDNVEIFGNIRKSGRQRYITLDKPNHYICCT